MPSRQLSTRQPRFACARLPDPHLTRSRAPFPRRSRPSALSRTPLEVVWSLPPQGDPRGPAILHLLRSTASSKVSYPIRPSIPRWRDGPVAVLPAVVATHRGRYTNVFVEGQAVGACHLRRARRRRRLTSAD